MLLSSNAAFTAFPILKAKSESISFSFCVFIARDNQLDKVNVVNSSLETFEKSLIDSLVSGHKVELRSFGSFFTRKIAEKRNARNPRTGEKIYVPEKIKLKFKASKELKKLINKTNA